MIIPIYQAELAHRKIRGRITSLQQLFNATGQVFATWIGTYCLAVGLKSTVSLTHLHAGYGCYMVFSKSGNSREWRIPLAIQIIPAIFLGALIFLFPESPRYF